MTTQSVFDFDAARARRDAGMRSSRDHANNNVPGWSDHAMALLRQYAVLQESAWTVEQFRPWAYERGLPKPDEERAFGAVTQQGIRYGVIVKVGYAPTASSNGSPKGAYLGALHTRRRVSAE